MIDLTPLPGELRPWPYGALPNAGDYKYGTLRIVIQRTEDGFYGFAFQGERKLANMIGPHRGLIGCEKATRDAVSAGSAR